MNSVINSPGTMLHVMYIVQFRGHDSVIGVKAHSVVPNRKFRYMLMIMMVLMIMMIMAMMVNG